MINDKIDDIKARTKAGKLPREERVAEIDRAIEEYFANTGNMPDGVALERLTDLLLYEELTDDNEHKVAHSEYPFLSERQFERRDNREHITKEETMEMNAVDGRRHMKPKRRKRTDYEDLFLDKKTRSINKERRKKYAEFTKVQPVITKNVDFS